MTTTASLVDHTEPTRTAAQLKPQRRLRIWLGGTLLAVGLTSASPLSAAEPAEAPAETAQAAAEQFSIPAPVLLAAEEHLTDAQRTKLKTLNQEQLNIILDTEDDSKLSEDELSIGAAVNKAAFESQLQYQTGDVEIGDGLAVLHLGEEFRYLADADAQKVLVDAWGNPPGSATLGMIVPSATSPLHDKNGWAVIVTYSEDGYVDDEDAEDIDYDELLEQMQEDTQEANPEREAQGYGRVDLIGWAEPPHYDSNSHRLYWAQHLRFSAGEGDTLNYAIRVLGRKGVLELNAVAGMDQLPVIRKDMEKVLPRAEFQEGKRYTDFNPDLDEVAAYGIGGLIAGKVLAKVGLFAGLLKLIIAMKKILILGAIAFGGALMKLFGRGKKTE